MNDIRWNMNDMSTGVFFKKYYTPPMYLKNVTLIMEEAPLTGGGGWHTSGIWDIGE